VAPFRRDRHVSSPPIHVSSNCCFENSPARACVFAHSGCQVDINVRDRNADGSGLLAQQLRCLPVQSAEVVVGGAGAFKRDHPCADGRFRCACGAEDKTLHSQGLMTPFEHFAALAGFGIGDADPGQSTRSGRRFSRRRLMPRTVYLAPTSSGSSALPSLPVAPVTRTRITPPSHRHLIDDAGRPNATNPVTRRAADRPPLLSLTRRYGHIVSNMLV
jgi:hypothetical protein